MQLFVRTYVRIELLASFMEPPIRTTASATWPPYSGEEEEEEERMTRTLSTTGGGPEGRGRRGIRW